MSHKYRKIDRANISPEDLVRTISRVRGYLTNSNFIEKSFLSNDKCDPKSFYYARCETGPGVKCNAAFKSEDQVPYVLRFEKDGLILNLMAYRSGEETYNLTSTARSTRNPNETQNVNQFNSVSEELEVIIGKTRPQGFFRRLKKGLIIGAVALGISAGSYLVGNNQSNKFNGNLENSVNTGSSIPNESFRLMDERSYLDYQALE